MSLVEIQIDRVVGPTHHFGGLGVGNLASAAHRGQASNPRSAALQGLDKMKLVASLGVPQFILPPQSRPNNDSLKQLGYPMDRSESLDRILREAPGLLSAACSGSAMWTANAATITPAIDSTDDMTHVTIANLCSSLHRAIEPNATYDDLAGMQTDGSIAVELPLPACVSLRDEGAANHMRLAAGRDRKESSGQKGLHVFVHGDPIGSNTGPQRFMARQTCLAFRAIARRQHLPEENCFFIQQHPDAIDAGAFHNDVVAMSHHGLWIHHEQAYIGETNFDEIESRYREESGETLDRVAVSSDQLSLDEAIATYLFNSQIITTQPDQPPSVICPMQVKENPKSRRLMSQWISEKRFAEVHYVELRQSMAGGGGPACLRLRVPLQESQIDQIKSPARWTQSIDDSIRQIINNHYPTTFQLKDLRDERLRLSIAEAETQLFQLLAKRQR